MNQPAHDAPPPTDGPIFRPRRLAHANLFVSDYERAAQFYHDVVGFREVYRQPDNMASFLSNGNTYHDLALTDIRSKYGARGQQPGLWHLAFETESEAELVDDYLRALENKIEFAFVQDHDVAHSVYQHDPDGNLVELYADTTKDWRAERHGIIIKEKPQWIPGVTNVPQTARNYPQDPELDVVADAVFHPRKIAHTALVARNFEAMFRFYTRAVGLAPVLGNEAAPFALLQGHAGTGDLSLHRLQPGLDEGFHHAGFEVWSEDDLERSLQALSARGLQPEFDVGHAARRSVCIRDPDGLRLHFFVNRDWRPETLASIGAAEALKLL